MKTGAIRLFVGFLIIVNSSCFQSSNKETSIKNRDLHDSSIMKADTFKVKPGIETDTGEGYDGVEAHLDTKDYAVDLVGLYEIPKGFGNKSAYRRNVNYIYFTTKSDSDTIAVQFVHDHDYMSGLTITDETENLEFHNFVFCITYRIEDDYHMCEYFEFNGDSLVDLFGFFQLSEIHRKDEHTLVGSVINRDEVVSEFYNCPFKINLVDSAQYDSVQYEEPDTLDIHYDSKVREALTGYSLGKHGNKINQILI